MASLNLNLTMSQLELFNSKRGFLKCMVPTDFGHNLKFSQSTPYFKVFGLKFRSDLIQGLPRYARQEFHLMTESSA